MHSPNSSKKPHQITDNTFSQTDLTIADKYKRLEFKIKNRCVYFEEQCELRIKHPYYLYYLDAINEFTTKAKALLCQLEEAGNYFKPNKTGGGGKTIDREKAYKRAYNWSKDWPKRREHFCELTQERLKDTNYLKETDKRIQFLLNMLKEAAYATSTETIKTRLKSEMYEALENEWYMIFATHTVDPEHYESVFAKGSNIWRNYIRRIKREIGNVRKNHELLKNQTDDYFHYMAVIEEGGTTGRLHIHCMMFLKELIPVKDPNYGINPPIRKEIDEYCEYWKYGHSNFIPIRFSNSDPYGKRGWVWPMVDGRPIPPSDIHKITNYMVKYVTKSIQNTKGKVWRTKTDRKLGVRKLQSIIRTLKTTEIRALVEYRNQPIPILIHGHRCPWKMIRLTAVKELVKRLNQNRAHLKCSEKNTIFKTLLKHGIQTKLDHRFTSIGDTLLQLFRGKDTSKIYLKDYMAAKETIEAAMPEKTWINPVAGGNTNNT